MNAQPILITEPQLEQMRVFAERAVRSVNLARAEARRQAIAHAVTIEELAVVRMALTRGDVPGALVVIEALMRHAGAHASALDLAELPVGVVDLSDAREQRIAVELMGGRL